MPKQMAAVLFSEEKTQKDVSRGQRKSSDYIGGFFLCI